jgi:hypothetical protein
LSESEREQLQIIIKKGINWRERAQTILMLSEGQTVFAVAEQQCVILEAIQERRRQWVWRALRINPVVAHPAD